MRRIRLWALAGVGVLAAYILLFGSPHYEPGDDAVLLWSLLAGETYSLYTHPLLHWPLLLLTTLVPSAAWMSAWQMGMLALGAYGCLTGGMRMAEKSRLPLRVGFFVSFACCAATILPCANNVTYTLTGAALGMAAMWQLLGGAGAGRSFLYLLLGFCLRDAAVLPSLAFWLGGLVCLWKLEDLPLRKILRAASACLGVLALMAAAHDAQAALSGERAYADWQESRIAAMDYGDLSAQETWTQEEAALVGAWCLMDESVTQEALNAVPQSEPSRQTLGLLFAKSRWMYWLCALTAAAFLCGCLGMGWWSRLAALCGGLLGAAMLMYLALKGRLPARAAAAVVFPAIAYAAYLLLRLPVRRRTAALMLISVLMIPCLRQTWTLTRQPKPESRETVFTRLDEYALSHPDELIIGDHTLGRDLTLFPVRDGGFPRNLLLAWGGWNTHSAGYRETLAAFGYEHDRFRMGNLLDEPIRLAVKAGGEPMPELLRLMEAQCGQAVRAVLCHEGDGYLLYRFEKEGT